MTPQRSRVRARMSAHIAATAIGRPRIEPELSISSDTTVSRNSVSFSSLYDSGCSGLTTTRVRRAVSSRPSSRSNSQERVSLGHEPALQAIGHAPDHALEAMQLLVELGAQPGELYRAAQLVGLDHLVEPGGEHAIGERLAAWRDVLGRLERGVAALAVVGAMSCRVLQPLARPGRRGGVGAGAGVGLALPARRPRRHLAPPIVAGCCSSCSASPSAGSGSSARRALGQPRWASSSRTRSPNASWCARCARRSPSPGRCGSPARRASYRAVPAAHWQVEPEQALLRVQAERSGEIGLFPPDRPARGDGGRRARLRDWPRRQACAGRREPRPAPARARRRSLPQPRPRRQALMQLGVVVAQARRRPLRRAAVPRPGQPWRAWAAATAGRAARPLLPAACAPPAGQASRFGGAETDAEGGLVGDRATGRGERALKAFQTFLAERAHRARSPSQQGGVDRALRQLDAEAALIVLGDDRALGLVTLVQKRQPEGKADIAEDQGILRPGQDVRGDITVEMSPATKPARDRSARLTICEMVLRLSSLWYSGHRASTMSTSASCSR